MKKVMSCALLVVALSSCANSKKIDGITYESYGIFNDEKKNPKIKYNIVWGNVLWSVILSETIIAPVYFIGFSISKPTCRMPEHVGEAREE